MSDPLISKRLSVFVSSVQKELEDGRIYRQYIDKTQESIDVEETNAPE